MADSGTATRTKGKIKWKPILAVLLILGILGLFFMSDFGRPFLGSFGEGLGGFTGFVFKPKPTGPGFEIALTTTKENFYTQKYKLDGSTLAVDGTYSFIKIGGQTLESKSGKSIKLTIKDIKGTIEFTSSGSITLTGTTMYAEIGDLIASSDKAMSVDIEIIPNTASLSGLNLASVKFASITGRVDRYAGETYDSVTLKGGKLNLETLVGELNIDPSGVKMTGTVTSATGDNFSFV